MKDLKDSSPECPLIHKSKVKGSLEALYLGERLYQVDMWLPHAPPQFLFLSGKQCYHWKYLVHSVASEAPLPPRVEKTTLPMDANTTLLYLTVCSCWIFAGWPSASSCPRLSSSLKCKITFSCFCDEIQSLFGLLIKHSQPHFLIFQISMSVWRQALVLMNSVWIPQALTSVSPARKVFEAGMDNVLVGTTTLPLRLLFFGGGGRMKYTKFTWSSEKFLVMENVRKWIGPEDTEFQERQIVLIDPNCL